VSPPCNAITIVIVDDDTSFRSGLAANLEDDGHVVGQYDDPKAVPPDLLQRALVVVVTDYQMAETDGLTFADNVHAVWSQAAIVLATAYWTVEIEAAVAARSFVALCRKPVDYDDLHELMHRMVGGA